MINLERFVDRLTETPARLLELVVALVIFAPFGWQHSFGACVNGLIASASVAVFLRISGISANVATALGMGPDHLIQGTIRPRDFHLLRVVVFDNDDKQVWRRLAQITVRGNGVTKDDVYDVLVDPQSVGTNSKQPVFRSILFRHRDEHIWPTNIMFDRGVVNFDFRKIDPALPPLRVSLRKGEEIQTVRRTSEPPREPEQRADKARPERAMNRYDATANAIIGSGPSNRAEAGRMRREIAKAIHPDRGTPDERIARGEALARANKYLDTFKT